MIVIYTLYSNICRFTNSITVKTGWEVCTYIVTVNHWHFKTDEKFVHVTVNQQF